MGFKTLIADDENPARIEMKYLLEKYSDIEIVHVSPNGIEAAEYLKNNQVDIVFLDIQMPQVSGLDLAAEIIKEKSSKEVNIPYIVFVTAFDEYAVKAFELNAVDYILKPVNPARLDSTVARIRKKIKESSVYSSRIEKSISQISDKKRCDAVTVYSDGRFYPVRFSDIIMVSAGEKYSVLHTACKKYEYRKLISEVETLLPEDNFFRSHRSYIINLDYIETIDFDINNRFTVSLKGIEFLIPVSRSRTRDFKQIMQIA